jgi:hypothetical protein
VTISADLEHPALAAAETIATGLDTLAAANLWSLPEPELGGLLIELERLSRRLAHAQIVALAQADGSGLAVRDGATSLPAWLRAAADVPIAASQARLALHAGLRARPAAAAAFAGGDISMDAAAAVCAALDTLPTAIPAALTSQVEHLLVETARDEGTRAVTRRATDITHRFAPEQLENEEQAQREATRLRMTLRPDGTVALRGQLDKEAAALAHAVLGPLAAPASAVDGTPDLRDSEERYGAALTRALELASQAAPDARGERPHVVVTIGLEALQRKLGCPPGRLDTGAPLSAAAARRLACDAGIIPAVLGSPSEPLDIGRASRAVPTGLRRALAARDQGCAFPGCDRPMSWCDAHHIQHWADSGPTAISNLVLVCARHHSLVHHDGWTVRLNNGPPTFTPPRWIDPNQKPRQHTRYRLQELDP